MTVYVVAIRVHCYIILRVLCTTHTGTASGHRDHNKCIYLHVVYYRGASSETEIETYRFNIDYGSSAQSSFFSISFGLFFFRFFFSTSYTTIRMRCAGVCNTCQTSTVTISLFILFFSLSKVNERNHVV